ncbi:toxin TcdB middle/N-terminal domain-containing protein [Abyssogena phaseoliformis symbiont]|uniref:toxin TcdB middle/N-terminal domain-containing protein n=1 Tax=Abyssogena phaseoliformis symbiont TaxID=596095 RepID=UPI001CEC1DC8|nr:toxin TcdB middle/N-terminal domain-containing protein [Abyssogena phaseoliformis symbiont]
MKTEKMILKLNSKIETTKRLRNIQTFANNSLVRDYQANYQYSSKPETSQITEIIQKTGGGEETLSPIVFTWDEIDLPVHGKSGQCYRQSYKYRGWGRSKPSELVGYNEGDIEGFYPNGIARYSYLLEFVDVNGDGLSDMIVKGKAFLSNGSSFYANKHLGSCGRVIYKNYEIRTYKNDTYGYADVNGDGKADFIKSSDGMVTVSLSTFDKTKTITSIDNGFNISTTINYKPLTGEGIYQQEAKAYHPNKNIYAPMLLVSSTATNNAIGGQNTATYQNTVAQRSISKVVAT